ncbi:MAG: D-alanine--D-alanine ligase family protein, partial [Acidithiobacillus ferrivorans]
MSDLPRVAVLYGGPSGEREVSLSSGQAVLQALQGLGLNAVGIDIQPAILQQQLADSQAGIVFNICHGAVGEDGLLQACLEMLNISYTGSGVLASALAMDKWRCKQLWRAAGLPVTDGILLRRGENA